MLIGRYLQFVLYLFYLTTMVLSDYSKLRILSLHWKGYTVSNVVGCLVLEDGIKASKQGVRQFLKRYHNESTEVHNPRRDYYAILNSWLHVQFGVYNE